MRNDDVQSRNTRGDSIFANRRLGRLFLFLHACLLLFAVAVVATRVADGNESFEIWLFAVGAIAVVALRYFPTRRPARSVEMWAESLGAWGLPPRYAPWGLGAFFGVWSLLALFAAAVDR